MIFVILRIDAHRILGAPYAAPGCDGRLDVSGGLTPTVKVRIGFKQKDSRIVPEMGARVSFLGTSSASPGISGVVLPAEAVQISADAGVVFVISGDAVERRAVRLGARTADGVTILAGLRPGSVVALGDFSKFADGSRVRIVQ
jgi:hypothetical protein